MPPPRKRPRLHFIGSSSPEPDLELATARKRNDNLLKTCWESVFHRYERDFTGIADEIGLISGELEVDNGHLRSMQNEKDIVQIPEPSSKFDGRRMLRAMTIAPTDYSDSISDTDEVLQSIETIADNALMSNHSSQDEVFDEQAGAEGEGESAPQDDHSGHRYGHDYASDSWDDLFDSRSIIRSPSVDSLFVPELQDKVPIKYQQETLIPKMDAGISFTPPSETQDLTSTTIREQIRRIIQEEKEREKGLLEEKVEPAWRLPVQLPTQSYSPPASAGLPTIASTDHSPPENENGLQNSTEVSTSIWAVPSRARRPKRIVVAERNLKRIRAESEDPLQEGFSSEPEASTTEATEGVPSQSPSRHTTTEHQSPPLLRHNTVKHVSQLSRKPSVRASVQPSPAEPPTTLRYATRRALRQRTSKDKFSVAELSPQDASDVAEITPVLTAFVDSPAYQWHGRPDNAKGETSLTGAETFHEDDQLHHGLDDREEKRLARATSPDDLMIEVKEEAEAEQHEDTIVVRAVSQANGALNRRRTQPSIPKTPRASHPWEMQTSRSGQPMTKLSVSLRRSAGQKYRGGQHKPASAIKPPLANRATIATLGNLDDIDPALAEIECEKVLKPLHRGICAYCNASYQDANTAGSHWDRVLTKFAAGGLNDDDPHDIEFLHSVRSKVDRRSRAPRTLLRDFRLMVELHEGGGLTFQQISAAKLLYTSKRPLKLAKEYQFYRREPPAETVDPWTEELVEKLWQAVAEADENTTMTHIRRQLVGNNIEEMSMRDLGSKLAKRFLEEYRSRNGALGD